ncbi:uncharacterized protein LOC129584263 [Paramacrobiotus metropolitanus]|uniref:uncharacterized protein LOC129584263 n=1 Tax=Paramacrobiotus metropolitanus TaxID=2943436 RepID=UPI002445BB0D|nr:uncharacterized protein LOC129584263 [Paramacrobiotus metropolitanus]
MHVFFAIFFGLLALLASAQVMKENVCGHNGVVCIGIPNGCPMGGGGEIDFHYCDALAIIQDGSYGWTRIDLWGSPLFEEAVGGTTHKWVGLSFSEEGDTNNSPGVYCLAAEGNITTQFGWNTLTDRMQPGLTGTELSIMENPMLELKTSWDGLKGFRCSLMLEGSFTVKGHDTDLGTMAFYSMATGLITKGTAEPSGRVYSYMVTRVKTRNTGHDTDRSFASYCPRGNTTAPLEDFCDMTEYTKYVADSMA